MLRSRSLFALVATTALAFGSTACVVTWGEGPIQDDDSSIFDDDDFTTGATTGAGGDDSTTGAGGSDATDATSTGAGGDDTTSTGAGGDPYCIDGSSSGQTAQMCEDLAISPDNMGICEDGFSALGYAACTRGFEIWEGGFAEALAECLAFIPMEDGCSEQPVIDCVQTLYADSCDVPYIEDNCNDWSNTCGLDAAQCTTDLTPFNDSGLNELTDCMNVTDGTCQEAYDTCFEEVTALD